MKLCSACNNTFADTETFCPHDGEVLQESPQDIVGRVIDGKYQVETFIAQGGMGAVYRARHILLGDQVVIKTLRPEMRGNAEWLKRFQREGKAARAFRHPNSVTVYDLSAGSDGLIYMVMEYVEGHTLDRELKRRGRFTPRDALAVLEPVADVLDSAHGRGVVHRDLKPENIMLGRDDRGGTVVKVLDLGIAKMVGAGDVHAASATSLTVAGQLLGTPYYMSPEQWGELPRDGNSEVDGRTDIYSLGVIFFELVAGRKPLGGRTLAELRQKHVTSPAPSLLEVGAEIPEEFGGWVARAMSKDRADRPQAAGELIDGLRASLGLQPRARSVSLHEEAGGFDGGPATGAFSPETNAGAHAGAETILTSDFDSPASEGARATSAETPRAGAAVRTDASRETIIDRAAGTRADSRADASRAPSTVATQAAAAHAASTPRAVPEVAPPRRSLAPLVAGGALALLLVAGVGGWLMFRGPQPTVAPVVSDAPGVPAEAAKVEAAGYWFETLKKNGDKSGERVAELAPAFAAGAPFRIHFVPKERGYLYVIGPDKDGNAQTTFLTVRGGAQLKTNRVGAGEDFAFPPAGSMSLDPHPGADEFTFIFAPQPLAPPDAPAFFEGEPMRELKSDEVSKLEEFRSRFKSDAPALSVVGEGGERRVVVNVPATAKGRTYIFDVRVNHEK